jgi:hypothetical protein
MRTNWAALAGRLRAPSISVVVATEMGGRPKMLVSRSWNRLKGETPDPETKLHPKQCKSAKNPLKSLF